MLYRRMGLVAVPGAELLEDRSANLLEAKLQNHGTDRFVDRLVIDVGFGEIEVCSAKRERAIAQAGLEDSCANIVLCEGAKIVGSRPAREVIIPPGGIGHDAG
jgi:hypothetical protein